MVTCRWIRRTWILAVVATIPIALFGDDEAAKPAETAPPVTTLRVIQGPRTLGAVVAFWGLLGKACTEAKVDPGRVIVSAMADANEPGLLMRYPGLLKPAEVGGMVWPDDTDAVGLEVTLDDFCPLVTSLAKYNGAAKLAGDTHVTMTATTARAIFTYPMAWPGTQQYMTPGLIRASVNLYGRNMLRVGIAAAGNAARDDVFQLMKKYP